MSLTLAITGLLLVGASLFLSHSRKRQQLKGGLMPTRVPWLPAVVSVGISLLVSGSLLWLSLKYWKNTSFDSFSGSSAIIRTLFVLISVGVFAMIDQMEWRGGNDRYRFFYAFVLGTLLTWVMIAFKRSFFETGIGQNPYLMAGGIIAVILGWRFIFGPWSVSIRATVLGSFIFWVAYAILRFKTQAELIAMGIAAITAMIPVLIWCWLFLSYHRQRLPVVLLAFFAGMLSTAPILFYSALVDRGIELNFFLFRVIPVSFHQTSQQFVKASLVTASTGVTGIVLKTLVTYLIVGVIEELSKYWVLRKSSRDFFRSIDDALQLGIVVALGFAFAENLLNPTYFVRFVEDYILSPDGPQWSAFIGSVVGRGVLTSMVHILSTGVLGYFLGLASFATPLLREEFDHGKFHPITTALHRLFSIPLADVYARTQMLIGLGLAMVLHGIFDFIVSLPEVLPGHPETIGALFHQPEGTILSSLSITMVPALLYVIGGFWLLVYLFERVEDQKERGQIVEYEGVMQ